MFHGKTILTKNYSLRLNKCMKKRVIGQKICCKRKVSKNSSFRFASLKTEEDWNIWFEESADSRRLWMNYVCIKEEKIIYLLIRVYKKALKNKCWFNSLSFSFAEAQLPSNFHDFLSFASSIASSIEREWRFNSSLMVMGRLVFGLSRF